MYIEMNDEKFPYLFSSTPLLFEPNAVNTIPIVKEKLHEDHVEDDEVDSDLLSHSDMSWGSLEDRYVLFEIVSDDSASTTSSVSPRSSSSSSLVLDQMPAPSNEDVIHCVTESNWGGYALDPNSWDDDRAPVVKIRHFKDVSFNDLEFCGFLTDRLIGIGSSFLSKSPENGLYVLNKCVMRNMSLSDITMLYYHRYLRYIDLSYNYISNFSPLGGVPYLMYLNVAHNRTNIILDFTPPWYLTYVNLSYNNISKMRDISSFWSIVHLDLSHNAIEVISGLQNLKYLKHLNLSYNLIECMENLDKMNIEELNLEGNCITSFKSAIAEYGINTLPHLRKIYLGYNKISNLDYFKGGYSLRIIDLKFNRINDLLELSNFKGLIDEIDLRGNGCTKWPNYKSVLLYSIPSIQLIDGVAVSTSEKVSAATLFASPVNLIAARTVTKLTLLEQLSTPKIDLHVVPYDKSSPPLIVLTGPCAVKKISLAFHIAQTLPKKVKYCQWYTTRESEDSEIEQQIYIFVNREEFNDMSRCGDFLAIQELLGNSYGFHHNQIASLILENKIGITQMDLHATMQMSKRYSNIKPILVLTKSEEVHRSWIQEKFDVYACVRDSMENLVKENNVTEKNTSESTNAILHFTAEILNDIIENLQLSSHDIDIELQDKSTITNAVKSETTFSKEIITKSNVEMEENKYIKFQKEEEDEEETDQLHANHYKSSFKSKLKNQNELRVILDEHSNIVIENEKVKRERHQAKLLYRRNTLIFGARPSVTELSESISSEEILTNQVPLELKRPELLKNIYTELVIKTRRIYLDQHINKPGFFSLVLLTDDYFKAFNKLINFIYELYLNHSTEKSKFLTEIEHFSQVAVSAMIDNIVDEIRESLSTSKLQRRSLLRTYGITSWKDLMPSQRLWDSLE